MKKEKRKQEAIERKRVSQCDELRIPLVSSNEREQGEGKGEGGGMKNREKEQGEREKAQVSRRVGTHAPGWEWLMMDDG